MTPDVVARNPLAIIRSRREMSRSGLGYAPMAFSDRADARKIDTLVSASVR